MIGCSFGGHFYGIKLCKANLVKQNLGASRAETRMSLEIESSDVIRIMLQFLKEHNLVDSMKTLQKESGITLNTVDNIDNFTNDIRNGKWDSVLSQTAALKLPGDKLASLYEQVIFELLEAGERDLAKVMLRSSAPLVALKSSHLERYLKLELLCKRPFFTPSDAYELGSSKELRRQEIADSLACEVSVVPPSRMLALLGQALKYQQSQNLIPAGVPFDLLRNARKSAKKDSEERIPKRAAGDVRSTGKAKVDAIAFSPNGECLVTGSAEGLVEAWDVDSGKLKGDLEYQTRGEFINLEDTVLCAAFSRDGDQIATGSKTGQIKVWKLSTGACVRAFGQAHPQGITSLTFSRDGTQILSASYDQTARIHGMKSGKALKEFRGHTSYVNCAIYTKDSSNTILTGSSDGTVKLWDLRSTECMLTYRPGVLPGVAVTHEIAVHTLELVPNTSDQVLICTNSPHAYIMTVQGQPVRRFSSGKQPGAGGDFNCATMSPQGKWLYCVGEDGVMYIFDARSGQLESVLSVSDGPGSQVLSITHHPHRNLIATTANNECVKLWKP